MRITTGKVIDGKVVLENDRLPLKEGAKVTILATEDGETFDLTDEEEAALVESLQQIERGDFISAEELLRRIDKRT